MFVVISFIYRLHVKMLIKELSWRLNMKAIQNYHLMKLFPLPFFIAFIFPGLAQDNLSRIVEKVRPSLVTVLSYDKDGKIINQGCGFFLNQNGDIIINQHLIVNADSVVIKTAEGRAYPIVKVISEHKGFIMINADVPKEIVNPAKLADSLLSPGESVTLIGNSSCFRGTVTEMSASFLMSRDMNSSHFRGTSTHNKLYTFWVGYIIQTPTKMSFVPNVGPVINTKGEVVGILAFHMEGKNNYNFILSFLPLDLSIMKSKSKERTLLEWKKSIREDWLESYEGLFVKGKAYWTVKDYDEALLYYKKALKALENYQFGDSITKKRAKIDLFSEMGRCNVNLKNYGEAIKNYKQALANGHSKYDSCWPYYYLGKVYYELGSYNEAIEYFNKSIELDSFNFLADLAYSELGLSYFKIGQYSKAIESYKQEIRMNPGNAYGHFNLGVVYINLGQYEEAKEAFKQAIRLNPDYTEAHFNLGVVYINLGQYGEAKEAFKQAIRLNPDYAEAHYGLGLIYLSLGDKSSALYEYKILKKLDRELANELFDSIYK